MTIAVAMAERKEKSRASPKAKHLLLSTSSFSHSPTSPSKTTFLFPSPRDLITRPTRSDGSESTTQVTGSIPEGSGFRCHLLFLSLTFFGLPRSRLLLLERGSGLFNLS
ncbi:hypothetical protein MRB53_003073 [Persea americana]|uniref:Uncharacterized protein n=1 Tax=Persea americana TaxID=3435 RepID=A0ACC2MWE1_PERAE|nr:hypothetical protein MRB53_003073 [Persea americana]